MTKFIYLYESTILSTYASPLNQRVTNIETTINKVEKTELYNMQGYSISYDSGRKYQVDLNRRVINADIISLFIDAKSWKNVIKAG